jgi:hypothetical protein
MDLATQYHAMDPASNILKRNLLAEHLREVIDTLEAKSDQISALYDALKLGNGGYEIFDRVRTETVRDGKGKVPTRS